MAETAVEVVDLTKTYGPVRALRSVSFKVDSGGYFVLLGPSGGGKTTLLRLIGGFVRPTSGQVLLHGVDMTDLPPNERPTSMVFQSYALFPHMTVARNVAYGLRLRRLSAEEIRNKVDGILELVGLAGYQDRMPHELSGGQQQRVQLARSLVLERDILLLDEPLAALDANLRKEMCLELKRLQEKVGITFIHVTHNQEEAMTVADHLAIIADGELVEQGTPRDVYERPVKRFTADFIGENNLFGGRVLARKSDRVTIDLGFAQVEALVGDKDVAIGDTVTLSVRSELLRLLAPGEKGDGGFQIVSGTYMDEIYLGLIVSHLVKLADGVEVSARRTSNADGTSRARPGEAVAVGWRLEDARLHVE